MKRTALSASICVFLPLCPSLRCSLLYVPLPVFVFRSPFVEVYRPQKTREGTKHILAQLGLHFESRFVRAEFDLCAREDRIMGLTDDLSTREAFEAAIGILVLVIIKAARSRFWQLEHNELKPWRYYKSWTQRRHLSSPIRAARLAPEGF